MSYPKAPVSWPLPLLTGAKCPTWSAPSQCCPQAPGTQGDTCLIGGAQIYGPELRPCPLPSPCQNLPLYLCFHLSPWGKTYSHVTLLLKNLWWLPTALQSIKSLSPALSQGLLILPLQLDCWQSPLNYSNQPHKRLLFPLDFPTAVSLRGQSLCRRMSYSGLVNGSS